jgi:hypothetical protein
VPISGDARPPGAAGSRAACAAYSIAAPTSTVMTMLIAMSPIARALVSGTRSAPTQKIAGQSQV